MIKKISEKFSLSFLSLLIILSFCLLQIIRCSIFPQFMDIYYHLLVAAGFNQAGGYSSWDFWQYAPVGRMHIYPPFFHIILAVLMKLGAKQIMLAKFFEMATPIVFQIVLWNFIRKRFSERLAFFTLLVFCTSFSFFLSLINHIPATIGLILGLISLNNFLERKLLRSILLLVLCFYTHIGVSWFFAFNLLIFGLLEREYKKSSYFALISVFILSGPILLQQINALKVIESWGWELNEKYNCQISVLNYIFAALGLILIIKAGKKFRLLLSFFFSSFIFLFYPYRFSSSEGYLAIILLSAFFLDWLFEKLKSKGFLSNSYVVFCFLFLFISPTLALNKPTPDSKLEIKLLFSDSAFTGLLLARGQTIWFPNDYLPAANLIKNNSQDRDIVFSTLKIAGLILSTISERATANGLFPEIKASRAFDPILNSKIIVFTVDENPQDIERIVSAYKLIKIGQTKMFILYKNNLTNIKAPVRSATLPYKFIYLIALIFVLLYWQLGRQKLLFLHKKCLT